MRPTLYIRLVGACVWGPNYLLSSANALHSLHFFDLRRDIQGMLRKTFRLACNKGFLVAWWGPCSWTRRTYHVIIQSAYVQTVISACSKRDHLMFKPWRCNMVWNEITWFETKRYGNVSALKRFKAKSQSVSRRSLDEKRSFSTDSFCNELIL